MVRARPGIFHQQRHRSRRGRAEAGAAGRAEKGRDRKNAHPGHRGSFHGRTFGALSITYPSKYREPFAPLVPGVEFVRLNDVADLEAKFDEQRMRHRAGGDSGRRRNFPVQRRLLDARRELASQHGAALIADEIQCGLGRTGRAFGYQRHAAAPDIVVVAKALAGGLPLGAILAKESFAEAFAPGLHGSTFGGGPLACATALEFLNTVEEENLLENIRDRGAQFRAGLEHIAAGFDFVREIAARA